MMVSPLSAIRPAWRIIRVTREKTSYSASRAVRRPLVLYPCWVSGVTAFKVVFPVLEW